MKPKPISSFSIQQLTKNNEAFNEIDLRNMEDELFPCSAIQRVIESTRYALILRSHGALYGFAVPENGRVISSLVNNDRLWKQAKVRLGGMPVICGAAPHYGVPFRNAVDVALKSGGITSCFFKPETLKGLRCSKLKIKVTKVNDKRGSMLQMEAWQFSPDSNCAYYLHALSQDFSSQICHFDGATIQYSDSGLETMLAGSSKIKGDLKTKHFRLDGKITVDDMHQLASAFLPATELYDEAFEVTTVQN
ncbi:MAG: hypothetical protein NTV80_11110 [Verrucomicrobia bacterium]|nr:hypothetical protein [Verrucomicrobiota bacterium]